MREIKFRAWDKKDKVMYYGVEKGIDFDDRSHYEFKNFLGYQKKEDYHKWVLMQYTGLKDKNGKEIYEGDILCQKHDKSSPDGGYVCGSYNFHKENCKIVEWNNDESSWYIYPNKGFPTRLAELFKFHLDRSEIIGNTMENKELLEGK